MRFGLATINSTVGDVQGNAARIERACIDAAGKGVELLVFPELCLSGYPPRDLLMREGFVAACTDAAKRLGESLTRQGGPAAGLTLVLGLPLPVKLSELTADVADRPWSLPSGVANSLVVYRNGEYLDDYDKRLLPTYDVFDEDRYFVPGMRAVTFDVASRRVGLSICEDLWRGEDAGFAHRYAGLPDPVTELVAAGASLIINPSASPFVLGKSRKHRDILAAHARRHGVYVAGVNQVGGNDELVFDGHAGVYDPKGRCIADGRPFAEQLVICEIPYTGTELLNANSRAATPGTSDETLLFQALVLGIRDYCRKTGFHDCVLGLSGGIDSALTAVLAAAALGPQNVLGVSLPSCYSSQGSIDDARDIAHRLGIKYAVIPIEPPRVAMETSLREIFDGRKPDVTEENLQSRIRGTLLMALSNKFGSILLTTGNKSESAVGYATLYGDMNGGLAVLSDVTKQWVYRLSRWVNRAAMLDANRVPSTTPPLLYVGLEPSFTRDHIASMLDHARAAGEAPRAGDPHDPTALGLGPIPHSSIIKPPSAELRPSQTDQDTLPEYDVLDRIIELYVEDHRSPDAIQRITGYDRFLIARVTRMIDLAEFKRKQAAIGLKVTTTAFGSGRRMPIAQGWRG
jgi:NAD+ synthase (glutamine-hydrolysing)